MCVCVFVCGGVGGVVVYVLMAIAPRLHLHKVAQIHQHRFADRCQQHLEAFVAQMAAHRVQLRLQILAQLDHVHRIGEAQLSTAIVVMRIQVDVLHIADARLDLCLLGVDQGAVDIAIVSSPSLIRSNGKVRELLTRPTHCCHRRLS